MTKEMQDLGGATQDGKIVRRVGADLETVDICITTDFKDLEHVCLLAEVLAKRKSFG